MADGLWWIVGDGKWEIVGDGKWEMAYGEWQISDAYGRLWEMGRFAICHCPFAIYPPHQETCIAPVQPNELFGLAPRHTSDRIDRTNRFGACHIWSRRRATWNNSTGTAGKG